MTPARLLLLAAVATAAPDACRNDTAFRKTLAASAERARAFAAAAARGEAVVGHHRPLLGFFLAKTGSNSQQHYLLSALASEGLAAHAGCAPRGAGGRTGCLAAPEQREATGCAPAFGNHFRPEALVEALAEANRLNAGDKCRREGWPAPGDADLTRRGLQRSVCTAVLRDPVTRAVSAFYEFKYGKRTNLTAPAYLEKHGAEAFAGLVSMHGGYQAWTKDWPAVFENCFLGTTEDFDSMLGTLSRVLPLPETTRGQRFRSGPKPGLLKEHWPALYAALRPRLAADLRLWRDARCVAAAQRRAVAGFSRLLSDAQEDLLFDASCAVCWSGQPAARTHRGRQMPLPSRWMRCGKGKRAVGRAAGDHCRRVAHLAQRPN
eukprot:CAMPEP_0119267210 /NCGR_PEP_ID=MMETSP1329-20130426/5442_1 /TAXON_ID=114041 /ORGANISM="Genus nov. species nov., Strain RCC1024" /LENGTH=376 /DNA_ID=CAMNT_0007267125 /DNA_START=305 /DNA_END=1432 /DNA_ORIENTATION=+